MPPVVSMPLALDIVPLRVMIFFLGAIDAMEESFRRKFLVFGREILSVGTQISIKALVCGGCTIDLHYKKD